MTTESRSAIDDYQAAMNRAKERFQPLTDALMAELHLDVEPVVEQTGGMVMCLGIYWPNDHAYVWFSDYWWFWDDLILGLYEGTEDEEDGTYPEPPSRIKGLLVEIDDDEHRPSQEQLELIASAIAQWAAPLITAHGVKHGWESRFPAVHHTTIEDQPSDFARINGLAGNIKVRCTCGWTTTVLFMDTARQAASDHGKDAR